MIITKKLGGRTNTKDPAVEAGIDQITQLCDLGKTPAGETPSSPLLVGKTTTTIKEYSEKARKFARSYSPSELTTLISQCRKHHFKIGITHIIELLRIPDHKAREKVQADMALNSWSWRDLKTETNRLIGSPNSYAGRQPPKPVNAKHAWRSIGAAYENLIKVIEAAVPVIENGKPRKAKGVADPQPGSEQLRKHIAKLIRLMDGTEVLTETISQRLLDRAKQLLATKHSTIPPLPPIRDRRTTTTQMRRTKADPSGKKTLVLKQRSGFPEDEWEATSR